jgi:hypothetical protein
MILARHSTKLNLKGLSGENEQGLKVVPIDRHSFKYIPNDLLFNYFSTSQGFKNINVSDSVTDVVILSLQTCNMN